MSHDDEKKREDIDAAVKEVCQRFGLELDHQTISTTANARHRLMLAIIHQIVLVELALKDHVSTFAAHVAREDKIFKAIALVLAGIATVTIPAVYPAVESTVENLAGVEWNHPPIPWPTDILEAAGGGMIVVGVLMVFRPNLIPSIIDRIFRRK